MERGFSLFRDDRPLAGPPTGHCTPLLQRIKPNTLVVDTLKIKTNDSSCDWAESEHFHPG
ncbi:hypothetical protein A9K55_001842 [Cordyceps militaris]|uniref:Uncharacterized protein n=1 Tax=Cordyceps militaris TaxID=73501 RepID=A0A2H4SRL2_CORMI|nr:hypothetical protein A9K55_001842 [Cordyceps militaris]